MSETTYITEHLVRERISTLMAEAERERVARGVKSEPVRPLKQQALQLVQMFLGVGDQRQPGHVLRG